MSDDFAWDPVEGKAEWAEAAARRVANYEHQAVKFVLEHYRAEAHGKQWLRERGIEQLSFDLFHQQCPDFPVRLSAMGAANPDKNSFGTLAKRFAKSQVYKQFLELREDIAGEDRIGMCMCCSWVGFDRFVAVHNLGLDPDANHFCVVQCANQEQFVIEPLTWFLPRLGWEPSPSDGG